MPVKGRGYYGYGYGYYANGYTSADQATAEAEKPSTSEQV